MNDELRIGRAGVALVKEFEGCMLLAYPDPKTGGDPWTIGWGHTGPEVKKGLRWTQAQADAALTEDLAKYEAAVRNQITVPLTQNQFDALVSFCYNLGPGNLFKSTLRRLLNSGQKNAAADEFPRWISAGTPAEPGLRRRRAAERALFLS